MNVGIVGASGYSGEVLVRLLSRHPDAQLVAVTSRQHVGKRVIDVFPSVGQRLQELTFIDSEPKELARLSHVDVWFLALPHGVAAGFAMPLLEAGRVIIDLSADFRLNSSERYAEFYGHEHPCPELLNEAVYVIPELAVDDSWRSARLIACPGCYPTSVQLPLVPLLAARVLESSSVVITSLSGVSGAGRQAKEFYSYCERTESVAAYGQPKHRHLSEIEEQLSLHAKCAMTVQFSPHLVPMRCGILTSIVARAAEGCDLDAVRSAWNECFSGRPFVRVLPLNSFADTAAVVGTNRADLSAVYDVRTGNFVLSCVIDNLIKGASGQAIQIFNQRFGFREDAGL